MTHVDRLPHEAPAPHAEVSRDIGAMFLRAEQIGLKLVIVARTVTLVLLGAWFIGTRADDPARAVGYTILLTIFAALGLLHYALIGSRFDKSWVKYRSTSPSFLPWSPHGRSFLQLQICPITQPISR